MGGGLVQALSSLLSNQLFKGSLKFVAAAETLALLLTADPSQALSGASAETRQVARGNLLSGPSSMHKAASGPEFSRLVEHLLREGCKFESEPGYQKSSPQEKAGARVAFLLKLVRGDLILHSSEGDSLRSNSEWLLAKPARTEAEFRSHMRNVVSAFVTHGYWLNFDLKGLDAPILVPIQARLDLSRDDMGARGFFAPDMYQPYSNVLEINCPDIEARGVSGFGYSVVNLPQVQQFVSEITPLCTTSELSRKFLDEDFKRAIAHSQIAQTIVAPYLRGDSQESSMLANAAGLQIAPHLIGLQIAQNYLYEKARANAPRIFEAEGAFEPYQLGYSVLDSAVTRMRPEAKASWENAREAIGSLAQSRNAELGASPSARDRYALRAALIDRERSLAFDFVAGLEDGDLLVLTEVYQDAVEQLVFPRLHRRIR